MWGAVRSAVKPRALPTYMRAAVVSNDKTSLAKWVRKYDVDARHHLHGETMLMLAASHGLTDMVSTLLNAGADVNLRTTKAIDGKKCSALMTAAVGGHEDVVQLLLNAGAQVAGVTDAVDMALEDGLLSNDQHQRLHAKCCCCCPAGCTCCAAGCTCCSADNKHTFLTGI